VLVYFIMVLENGNWKTQWCNVSEMGRAGPGITAENGLGWAEKINRIGRARKSHCLNEMLLVKKAMGWDEYSGLCTGLL